MQTDAPTLEIPIQVFMVFFAISWGALANALPRWKAFDTGRFWVSDKTERAHVRRRFWWSFVVLTISPAVYFAVWLIIIGTGPGWHLSKWNCQALLAILCAAIGAWTPPFGLYRIWAFEIQRHGERYYPLDLCEEEWCKRFGSLQKEDVRAEFAWPNLAFAAFYLILSIGVPLTYLCVAQHLSPQ